MDVKDAKRISIIGSSGSGKSTLAKRLGEKLNLPVHHIDCYFWQPNWISIDKQELANIITEISKDQEWIFDGNYSATFEIRFERTDFIIFLDFPVEFCLESVKARRLKPNRVGLPEYLVEEDGDFEMLLEYIKNYPLTVEQKIKPLIEKYKDKFVILKDRKAVDEFVLSLS